MNLQQARKLRAAMVAASAGMDDRAGSEAPQMFGRLTQDGSLIRAGTRINWDGQLMKANTDLWDTAENTPDKAPELWTEVAYRNGYRVIPETFTAENAFMKGETGYSRADGNYYEAQADGTVFPPQEYPSVWKQVAMM